MKLDTNIYRIREDRLAALGFRRDGPAWRCVRPLGVGAMTLAAEVRNGALACRVLDTTGDEYLAYQIEGAQGKFIGAVRSAVEAFRQEFINACCEREEFHSTPAKALLTYAEREHGERLEFLWKQFPQDAILRRSDNRKWYAVFMVIPPAKIGLPEGDPIEIVDLRVTDKGPTPDGVRYFPGWHMNKKTWFTAVLDGPVPTRELLNLMTASRARAGS